MTIRPASGNEKSDCGRPLSGPLQVQTRVVGARPAGETTNWKITPQHDINSSSDNWETSFREIPAAANS